MCKQGPVRLVGIILPVRYCRANLEISVILRAGFFALECFVSMSAMGANLSLQGQSNKLSGVQEVHSNQSRGHQTLFS